MVKCVLLLIGLVIALAVNPSWQLGSGGNSRAAINNQSKLPVDIKLRLEVAELPGQNNPKSFWEAGYEVRIVDWRTIVEVTKAGGNVKDTGFTIAQSSFERRGLSRENSRYLISIPVKGAVLQRLEQQSQTPQAFLLVSTVRVYDAQLDRNFTFQVDRVWQFKLFPDGEASITIKIAPDGAFDITGPLPKTLPPGYTVIGQPVEQKSPKKP